MSQDKKEKVERTKSQMMKISLAALLIVLLFMIEMYEIITDPANMIVIGALGVFLLAAVYVEMLFIGKMTEKKVLDQEEAFENVYRSEKASYLLMRKYFDQMENKMENLGDISNIPYKELIAAQKALAKAQINRNKQNTNALLISNDRMMQRLTSIQNDITDILTNTNANENAGISEISTGLSEQDKAVLLEGNKDVLEKQQEILHNLKELESSLRNEILESANKVASMKSQQISVPQPQMQIQENEDMIPPLDIEEDFSFADISGEQEEKQSFENSSESNLDRLLQQMNIPDSFESESQPITEEPELQHIAEEPVLQPIEDELELQPILETPELQPMAEEPELQSILETPELQPILETPELQPILEEPELQPIVEEPELQSILQEPELQLIVEEPEPQPILEEPELQPIVEEPESRPVLETPELQPLTEEPELQPVLETPELQSMETPKMQAVTEELELQQPMEDLGVMAGPELELPLIGNMQLNETEVSENTVTETERNIGPLMAVPGQTTIMEQMELEPASAEPEVMPPLPEEPGLSSAAIEPLMEQSVSEPATESSSVTEPMMESSSVTEPTMESLSVTDPMAESVSVAEPMIEPVMEQTELEPQIEEPVLEPIVEEPVLDPAEESRRQLQSIAEKFQPRSRSALESFRTKSAFESFQKEPDHGTIKAEEPEPKPLVVEEPKTSPIMADSLKPALQPDTSESADEELEKIMKAMDIDDVSGDSLEDLDIDKILEVPLSDEKQGGAGSGQVMSSEEIAALIANTELLSEPETSKNDDMVDLSDPRHVMSSDEIATLIANM